MAETPQKIAYPRVCCFCKYYDIRHLVYLKNKDQAVLDNIRNCLQVDITQQNLEVLSICRRCDQKLKHFSEFKTEALLILKQICEGKREKSGHRTPASEKKETKRQREEEPREEGELDFLTKSVEKLTVSPTCITPKESKARKQLIVVSDSEYEEEEDLSEFHEISDHSFTTTGATNPLGTCFIQHEHSYTQPAAITTPDQSTSFLSDHQYTLPTLFSTPNSGSAAKTILEECRILRDEETTDKSIDPADQKNVQKALQDKNVDRLAFQITKIPSLLSSIKQFLLKDLEASLQTKFKKGSSVLFSTDPGQLLQEDLFASVILEMKEKTPFLLDILSICCRGAADSAKVAMVATMFGMIMQKRVMQAAAVQRLYTSLCIRFHANNKLLTRLNSIHLTLSGETKRNIIADFGNYSKQAVISRVKHKDGKMNGDNLDLRVVTGDMRIGSKNLDYHFFATDWTPDRVDTTMLPDDHPIGDIENVNVDTFLVNVPECNKFKDDLKILLAKDLVETFPCFKWMKLLLPASIPHDLSAEMSTKSEPCILPILLKNETSYSDCIGILKSYESQAKHWYTEAGRG